MKRVLSLDLSLVSTGWCIFERTPLYWGHWTIRKPKDVSDPERLAHTAESLLDNLDSLNVKYRPDVIVYEQSDWHDGGALREGIGMSKRRKILAINRRVQRSLGQAEGLLAMWASFRGIKIDSLGANEVKNALEAKTKESIALVVASMYPDLFGYNHEKGRAFTHVTNGNKFLSDHVTDAIAVAQVYVDQGHLKSLIEQSV